MAVILPQEGVGPLGADRTLIITLKTAPVFDAATRTLTYNATVLLKNATLLDDATESPVTEITNNIARAAQSYLIHLKNAGDHLPAFNLTDAHLFIDHIGGTLPVGWVLRAACRWSLSSCPSVESFQRPVSYAF
jgi:hypothetical protein